MFCLFSAGLCHPFRAPIETEARYSVELELVSCPVAFNPTAGISFPHFWAAVLHSWLHSQVVGKSPRGPQATNIGGGLSVIAIELAREVPFYGVCFHML